MKLSPLLLFLSLILINPFQDREKAGAEEIYAYDLSPLLMPDSEFLGFIGEDKQRIYMHFDSIWKDPLQQNIYHLRGFSTVKNNRCDFTGLVIIEAIEFDSQLPLGLDSSSPDPQLKASGKIMGSYLFSENPSQKHVGLFKGHFWSSFVQFKKGDLKPNTVENISDNYRNHQYQGLWRAYNSENWRLCNWGCYRIPQSGDLDIGAAEFSANPKYKDRGW